LDLLAGASAGGWLVHGRVGAAEVLEYELVKTTTDYTDGTDKYMMIFLSVLSV
jgi:hypothetical protein